jgi:hypothetical protein
MAKSSAGGVLLAGILALAIGGAGGYAARSATAGSKVGTNNSTGSMGGPGGGGGMMGGMMGGGQQQPQAGLDLARTVRNLATLQKLQGKGLTPQQLKTIRPILSKIKSADKITEDDAKKLLDELEKAVEPVKDTLAALTPQRGGGGMMGGMGGMSSGGGRPGGLTSGSGMPGAAGSGGGLSPSSMGGGGGARPDPEKPFATERNRAALDELIKMAGG